MVLLIDANIILDVLMNRREFVKDSSMIWKLCETEKAKGYVSALTFANLVYIMRKQLNPEAIEDVYRKLSLIFTFTDLSVSDLTRAAELNWSDFEDAVQSVSAERIHADYIITRNVRDLWCIENGVPVSIFYYHIRTLHKKVCEVPKAVDAISLGFIPLPKSGIDEFCIAGYNECT